MNFHSVSYEFTQSPMNLLTTVSTGPLEQRNVLLFNSDYVLCIVIIAALTSIITEACSRI